MCYIISHHKKHGLKYQLGSTPGAGCPDGRFTIKTLLHLRHSHNLPMWVLFADLVKAFNTSNHKPMIEILGRYGCPPKLQSTIAQMYVDSVVRLIIGKIDTSIPFQVGVKQGDSIAPVIFLFIIMAFAETLEKEWIKHGLHRLEFKQHTNSRQSSGRLTSHPRGTFAHGSLFELFCIFYVDNVAFAFLSRMNTYIGTNLVMRHFCKLGLKTHVGNTKKGSKTECIFFPPPGFFKVPTLPPPLLDPQLQPLATKPTQEIDQARRKQEDTMYDATRAPGIIHAGDDGIVTFTKHFKYLGSFISYSLCDDYDVDHQLAKASTSIGALQPYWDGPTVDLLRKYLIFCAIPINLLLYGKRCS